MIKNYIESDGLIRALELNATEDISIEFVIDYVKKNSFQADTEQSKTNYLKDCIMKRVRFLKKISNPISANWDNATADIKILAYMDVYDMIGDLER